MCPLLFAERLQAATLAPSYEIPPDYAPLCFALNELQYDPEAIRRVVRHLAGGGSVGDCAYLDEEDLGAIRDVLATKEPD